MPADTSELIAWTDGGCRGNPGGPGAWAFVLVHRPTGHTLCRAAAVDETTNNRMELSAAIEVLRSLRRPDPIEVRSDSRYLVDMVTSWMPRWASAGWKKKGGPILNLDLVMALHELTSRPGVRFTWVRGHNGDPGNELADQLANQAMDSLARGNREPVERRLERPPFGV